MEQIFLDIKEARKFIEQAVRHYEKGPAWFVEYLDDLYIRLGETPRTIVLDELLTVSKLHEDEQWMAEPFVVNMVYKLFDRLGRDTAGVIGY